MSAFPAPRPRSAESTRLLQRLWERTIARHNAITKTASATSFDSIGHAILRALQENA